MSEFMIRRVLYVNGVVVTHLTSMANPVSGVLMLWPITGLDGAQLVND